MYGEIDRCGGTRQVWKGKGIDGDRQLTPSHLLPAGDLHRTGSVASHCASRRTDLCDPAVDAPWVVLVSALDANADRSPVSAWRELHSRCRVHRRECVVVFVNVAVEVAGESWNQRMQRHSFPLSVQTKVVT